MKRIVFAESVWAKLKLTGAAALFILMLVLAGCPLEDDPEPPPPFVPVTGITGVPVWAEAGVALSLTEGTAEPANATNKTIVWEVKIPGTTGAKISDGKLTAAAAGTVTLTAAIVKGKSGTDDFTDTFTITVYPADQVPKVTRVTVNPSAASIEREGTRQFFAVVAGRNSPPQAVTWTVTGGSKAGTFISENGRLTVASDEPIGAALTVTAVSSADSTKSGTAEVSVIEALPFIPLGELGDYVAGLTENTAATPHTVKLARTHIMTYGVMGSINQAVKSRYITLDLSACSDNTISSPEGGSSSNNMNAINNNRYIVGIILPSELTSIGNGAFRECTYLESVVIPGSVTSIGYDAFNGCRNLRFTVTDPGSFRTLEEGKMLMNNTALIAYPSARDAVTIPADVTSIGNTAFGRCSNLTSVVISEGVTDIGSSAFYWCRSLASVAILGSVESIGNSAFFGCDSLASVDIPKGVTSIGDNAFSGCKKLANFVISEGVTSIGNSTFENCTRLDYVAIPGTVESIGERAFYGCSSLLIVDILEGVTSIGDNAFEFCTSLARVAIPGTVISIGNSAFQRCFNLKSVVISQGVTSIGDNAFSWCSSLASVTIPGSVTSIGNNAFGGCSRLASVTFAEGSRITPGNFGHYDGNILDDHVAFPGDLRNKYFATGDGAGTYTRTLPAETWTKQ